MKKTNYLFMTLVMSILLISCGGKNENKEGNTTEITSSESDVPLDQLKSEHCTSNLTDYIYTGGENHDRDFFMDIKRKGDKENFTGIGVEKDQNDSIINRAEIKNGWLVRYIHRIKKGKKYITISDLTYDDGKINDGSLFKVNDEKGFEASRIEGISYISSLSKYKNGKENIEWEMTIYPKLKIYLNAVWDEEGGRIISCDEVIALHLYYSKSINLNKTLSGFKPLTEKDVSDYAKANTEKNNFYYVDANQQTILNTLKNLKNEVKGFDYWEE